MEANITLFFNLVVTLFCAWVAHTMYFGVWKRARMDEKRFRLFALRDRLAILAMRGEIEPTSQEYKLLMGILNESVKVLNEFRITSFLKAMVKLYGDRKRQNRLNKIIVSMERHPHPEYAEILYETLLVLHGIYEEYMAPKLLNLTDGLAKLLGAEISRRAERVRNVDEYLEGSLRRLRPAA